MKNFFSSLLFLLVTIYCEAQTIIVPDPKPYPSNHPAQMEVGICQTDLTLPPGYPMSGYSINGRISRGYWIKPKATALYLRDTEGTPFVFVATDLWAITAAQKMAVLKALSKDPTTSFIGERELLLTATHAHHSSGAIEHDKAFASTSIGFGLDKAAFDYTISQIVLAIKDAMLSAGPGTVIYTTKTVENIAQNRSFKAYLRNSLAERQKYMPLGAQFEENNYYISEVEKASSIEEELTVLTVKNPDGSIKGILASYPVHPTATGDATEVYSGDIFGLASMKASQLLGNSPVIGFYNGAEGDVAPVYKFHQRYDAVGIADKLAEEISNIAQSGSGTNLTNGTITHRCAAIDISYKKVELNEFDRKCIEEKPAGVIRTASNAVVGAAVFAGASDGRTSLSSFGISDGIVSKKWDPHQGYKKPAIAFLLDNPFRALVPKPIALVLKKLVSISPSPNLPISIHKVGEVYFTGMPGEFTTMLGRRIKDTIAEGLKPVLVSRDKIALVGLANAYISYVTTPCEYGAQYYEGASNFFGVYTGLAFINEFKKLARSTPAGMNSRRGRTVKFATGSRVEFGPNYLGDLQVWNAEEGLQNLMVAANGHKVSFKEVPPDNRAKPGDTIEIENFETIVYSFDDQVNTIASKKNFYPAVELLKPDGSTIPLPEHILTIDQFRSLQKSKWTVRILNTADLKDTPLRIKVTSLSGEAVRLSAVFRVKGKGFR